MANPVFDQFQQNFRLSFFFEVTQVAPKFAQKLAQIGHTSNTNNFGRNQKFDKTPKTLAQETFKHEVSLKSVKNCVCP